MVVSKFFYAPLKSANSDIPFVGDSSSFGSFLAAVNEVKKEYCIGHVQKRVGTALRSYKNKRRGAVLSDGKGTGGKGPLTDPII